jgi:hypothetical protein
MTGMVLICNAAVPASGASAYQEAAAKSGKAVLICATLPEVAPPTMTTRCEVMPGPPVWPRTFKNLSQPAQLSVPVVQRPPTSNSDDERHIRP